MTGGQDGACALAMATASVRRRGKGGREPTNAAEDPAEASGGMVGSGRSRQPLNWLPSSSSQVKLARLPSSGGIDPLNRLVLRARVVRLESLPSSGGIVPLSWLA